MFMKLKQFLINYFSLFLFDLKVLGYFLILRILLNTMFELAKHYISYTSYNEVLIILGVLYI